jgi:xylose dehydrogenase (NAD/NADP)
VSDRELRIGVVGATARIHELALRPAMEAVEGVRLVHEGSRGGGLEPRDGVRRSEGPDAYERVVADDDVDLVYVPLPNHLHEEWVLAAAAAGRHVLCEKPLSTDAASAQRMADACDEAGVVLVEAYMTPYHPRTAAVLDAVRAGALGGPLREAHARMSGTLPRDDHRFSVANGGGALLDIGIYCLEPMLAAAGWDGSLPRHVTAHARRAGDGIDEATTALLELGDGTTCSFHVDFAAPDQQRLQLTGEAAAIVVDVHATPDRSHSGYVRRETDGTEHEVPTATGDCYEGMLAHVRDVVWGRAALQRPPARSVALARVLDAIAAASA